MIYAGAKSSGQKSLYFLRRKIGLRVVISRLASLSWGE
jgi:hypothetical protein